jgi:hypothetical protein
VPRYQRTRTLLLRGARLGSSCEVKFSESMTDDITETCSITGFSVRYELAITLGSSVRLFPCLMFVSVAHSCTVASAGAVCLSGDRLIRFVGCPSALCVLPACDRCA